MSSYENQTFDSKEQEVDWRLAALEREHIPVSEARLANFVKAVRESLNDFSVQLVEQQELRRLQNEKITTLNGMVTALQQQVTLLAVQFETQAEQTRPQSEG